MQENCVDKDIKNQLFKAYKEALKGLSLAHESVVVPVQIIPHNQNCAQIQVKITINPDEMVEG